MNATDIMHEQVRKIREKNECEKRLLLHNLSIMALRSSSHEVAEEVMNTIHEIHIARMKGYI